MANISPRQQANRDQLDATIRDTLDTLIDKAIEDSRRTGKPIDAQLTSWNILHLEAIDGLHGDRRATMNILLAEAIARLARLK